MPEDVSIIIPSRNETFLQKTITDLLSKGTNVCVYVVLDGYWPDPPLLPDNRLIQLHHGQAMGMRAAINGAAAIAKGKYLMKCDAHCMFGEGYDEILKADCDEGWIVIPRRYSLDAENWQIENNGKVRDYHYLCYPDPNKGHDVGMHGVEWYQKGRQCSDSQYDIDDNMSFQGSCWFMHSNHFHNFLGGMSEVGYGSFTQEPQEIGLKTWLGGGAVKINKKTWYAHLHKGSRYGRMWRMGRIDQQQIYEGHKYSAIYWMTNAWDKRVHDIEWLIDKFSPVPTWDNPQEKFKEWHKYYGI